MCNLNVIVLLEFISKDLYLLFAILLSSKLQNSIFYQSMRPKSGLKFPWPLNNYKFYGYFCGNMVCFRFRYIFSSPEPLGSQGELIGWP